VIKRAHEEEDQENFEQEQAAMVEDWKELVKAQQGTIDTLQQLVEKLVGLVQDLAAHASEEKSAE
jgi:hypothetical protein